MTLNVVWGAHIFGKVLHQSIVRDLLEIYATTGICGIMIREQ